MLFRGSERFNLPLGHIGYDCYELPAFLNYFDVGPPPPPIQLLTKQQQNI